MYRNCDLLFNFEKLKSFPFNLFIFVMYVYALYSHRREKEYRHKMKSKFVLSPSIETA